MVMWSVRIVVKLDDAYAIINGVNPTWFYPTPAEALLMRDPLPGRAAPWYEKEKGKIALFSHNQYYKTAAKEAKEFFVNTEKRDIFECFIPHVGFEQEVGRLLTQYRKLREKSTSELIKRGILYGWTNDKKLIYRSKNEIQESMYEVASTCRAKLTERWTILTNAPIWDYLKFFVYGQDEGNTLNVGGITFQSVIDKSLGRNIAFVIPPPEYLGVITYREEPTVKLVRAQGGYEAIFHAEYGCGLPGMVFDRKTLIIRDDLLNKL